MPFGKWPNFAACVDDMASQGKSKDSANRICGSIQARVEGTKFDSKLTPDELTIVKMAVSKDGMVKYTIDEVKELCPSCVEKMEKIGLKEVILPISYFEKGGQLVDTVKKEVEKFEETKNIEDVEIFRVGTWNGDTYSDGDLDKIVENFDKLKGKQAVPIKIGHSESQKDLKKEGLPAAGWVSSLKRVGDKLVAMISDMPNKIYELVKRKAYKKVSAEIYPVYKDAEGNKYDKVLRAVALLGGEIPAVEGLSDVLALNHSENVQVFKAYSIDMNEQGKKINFCVKVPKREKYTILVQEGR